MGLAGFGLSVSRLAGGAHVPFAVPFFLPLYHILLHNKSAK